MEVSWCNYWAFTLSEFREYEDMIKEGDGVDIDAEKFKEVDVIGRIHPIALALIPEDEIRALIHLSKFALRKHNEENGTQLEFVKLIKANEQYGGGFTYYITFEAKDVQEDSPKEYQLRVNEGFREEDIKVLVFRPKPSSPAPSSPSSSSSSSSS